MSAEELAGLVCHSLYGAGIVVTLSGGACVGIWSKGKYVSSDLDFIEEGPVPPLGFARKGRYFTHPETKFFIEFPTGPLMVGDQRVERVRVRTIAAGKLRLLSPTDCVKDRLAAFFHWNDKQALEQAVLVAKAQRINREEVGRWSRAEGHEAEFRLFVQKLRQRGKR